MSFTWLECMFCVVCDVLSVISENLGILMFRVVGFWMLHRRRRPERGKEGGEGMVSGGKPP